MSTVTQSTLLSPGLHHFFAPQGEGQTTHASHIKTKTQAKTDLTIVTNEGDTVTLSAKAALKASYASYNAQGRLQGLPEASTDVLKLSAKHKFSVAIEGNLNADESADIERLLGQITDIATAFFTGELDEAVSQALNTDDLDTIAHFNATLRFKQRVSVTQLSATEGNTPEMPKTDLAVKATATPSLPTPRIDAVVDDMVKAARTSELPEETLTRDLPPLVTTLFARLADALNFDASQRQLAATITSKFAQRLTVTEDVPATGSDAAKPALAVDVRTKTSQRLNLTVPDNPEEAETEAPLAGFKATLKTKSSLRLKLTEAIPASGADHNSAVATRVKATSSERFKVIATVEETEGDSAQAVFKAAFKAKSTQHLRFITATEHDEAKTAQQHLDALQTTRLVQQLKIA